jgi:hypothetical protein
MSNQNQKSMDPDFLDGIDDQFQRLMKLYGNGKRNGRSNGKPVIEDRLVLEILELLHGLPKGQKEEVLAFVQSVKSREIQG